MSSSPESSASPWSEKAESFPALRKMVAALVLLVDPVFFLKGRPGKTKRVPESGNGLFPARSTKSPALVEELDVGSPGVAAAAAAADADEEGPSLRDLGGPCEFIVIEWL